MITYERFAPERIIMHIKFEIQRFKHCYIFLYPIVYMICFLLLEQYVKPTHIIELPIDRKIPFCEYFFIPYSMWFLYVAVTVLVFFLFLDLGDFYRMCMHLYLGMTIFLIVSALYPNGQNLRPDVFPRDNLMTEMVKALYLTDTPTNILPSIHVYNSICIHTAIARNQTLGRIRWLNISSFLLMCLIILSTVFLKQHSVVDVISGIVLAIAFYPLFYIKNWIPYRSRFPIQKQFLQNKTSAGDCR